MGFKDLIDLFTWIFALMFAAAIIMAAGLVFLIFMIWSWTS